MQTIIRIAAGLLVMASGLAAAQELAEIALPPARTEGGKPLLQALKERKSTREFSAEALAPQTLSDLLWAAHGINRADGKRTAPSTKDWREIDIYVLTADGAYRHDVKAHSLTAVAQGDFRGLTGKQEFAATVPANLVYVADTTRMTNATPDEIAFYSAVDTGLVAQNVYLFCASTGLATVVRMPGDKPALASALKLPGASRVILVQSVGWPKK